MEVGGEEVAVEVVVQPGVGETECHTAGAAVDGGGQEAAPLGGVVDVEVDAVDALGALHGAVLVEDDGEDAVGGDIGRGGRHGRHRPRGEGKARIVGERGVAGGLTAEVLLVALDEGVALGHALAHGQLPHAQQQGGPGFGGEAHHADEPLALGLLAGGVGVAYMRHIGAEDGPPAPEVTHHRPQPANHRPHETIVTE